MNTKFETLEFKQEGAVGILTINRPQALNSLNEKVVQELGHFFGDVVTDLFSTMKVLILTGSGEKAFVAGADIKEMDARDPKTAKKMATEGQAILQKIEDLQIPVIAAVNGFALGGGLELAMACDFIIASKTARMGLPEVSLGLIPGYGGTQRLARYCGKGIARLVALSGDMYPAEQFEKWGLVTMVTEPAELMNTALKVARSISTRSPMAVKLAKRSINEGFDLSQEEGMKLEAQLFHDVFNSADKIEGVKAFVEKRPAQFQGR